MHIFFFQIQILNLCSKMYTNFFSQFSILKLCFEMYFLREQFIQNLWLLNSVAVALYFFIKAFTTRKTFAIFTCINTNLRFIKDYGLL